MGGIVFYYGDILEMCIGEGKILIVIMFVYLNVILGLGVYVIIVNEYLLICDVIEMGEVYSWFGLFVGINLVVKLLFEKCEVYNCDIIYLINVEVGFDYFWDNMVVC